MCRPRQAKLLSWQKTTEPTLRLAEGIARDVVIGLTILSRILGLVRTLVFSRTVGASCLGGHGVRPREPGTRSPTVI